ncbi:hypothetical protein GOBAR_DD10813 [Gossypium barbadense]|nr:hypothetical protein GOBAR_DD10813 [Gossypium barbadense]
MDLPLPQPPMESLAKALQVSLFSSLGYQHYSYLLMRTKKKDASITEEIAGSTSVSSSTTTGTAPPVMDNLRPMIPENLQHGP